MRDSRAPHFCKGHSSARIPWFSGTKSKKLSLRLCASPAYIMAGLVAGIRVRDRWNEEDLLKKVCNGRPRFWAGRSWLILHSRL